MKGRFVLFKAHGRLTKDKLPILDTLSQMSSLLVVLGSDTTFHHEWRFRSDKVRQNLGVHGGSEIVRVGDKHVAVAGVQEGVKAPRSDQRSIQISVAWWAPFVVRVGFARGRLYVRKWFE